MWFGQNGLNINQFETGLSASVNGGIHSLENTMHTPAPSNTYIPAPGTSYSLVLIPKLSQPAFLTTFKLTYVIKWAEQGKPGNKYTYSVLHQ